MKPALKWLIPLIFVLTLLAALAGLWPAQGTPYPLTTFRGEEVTINARGLYYWDTVSSAAQMQANDLVTLVLGLPLLAVSTLLRWQFTGWSEGAAGVVVTLQTWPGLFHVFHLFAFLPETARAVAQIAGMADRARRLSSHQIKLAPGPV